MPDARLPFIRPPLAAAELALNPWGAPISHLGALSLSPVPKPSVALLLAMGLAGLALRRH